MAIRPNVAAPDQVACAPKLTYLAREDEQMRYVTVAEQMI